MIRVLIVAVGLLLVIEGLLPFTAPGLWREVFAKLVQMSDGQIRFAGLSSVMVGLIVLFLVHA